MTNKVMGLYNGNSYSSAKEAIEQVAFYELANGDLQDYHKITHNKAILLGVTTALEAVGTNEFQSVVCDSDGNNEQDAFSFLMTQANIMGTV